MRDKIETTLDNILSLVSCSEDYGFNDDVFLEAMAGMVDRKCSDEEIAAYAARLASEPGYGAEAGDDARDRLTAWRDRYCSTERAG